MSDSMIEESAARLFSQNVDKSLMERFEAGEWPQRLWDLVADNGLPLALASEAAGGIAASWSDAYPILRGIGYWQVPLPLAETMIAAQLLARAGIAIPAGPIALIEEEEAAALTLRAGAAGLQVSGAARRVPWARYCRWALASMGGQIALIELAGGTAAASTVRITLRNNQATEPDDEVAFEGARCVARVANPLPDLAGPVRTLGALAKSAMMVGAMEWLLEQSVQYATDRVQFGKPIGRNQAIQQNLALMAGDVAAARMAAMVACNDAPADTSDACPAALFSIAVAKIRTGESATRATSIAHQVHGAIGFTYEHALNFATRRLWAWREAHGADAWWAQRLGEAVINARAPGYWPGVTQKQFKGMGA
jgi:acyl-CoA dehydrogenase